MIDLYGMLRTDGPAEKSTQPIVHAWCVRVNINATRCENTPSWHLGEAFSTVPHPPKPGHIG